jgi:ParB-like chromosome segregation protein Spo0J
MNKNGTLRPRRRSRTLAAPIPLASPPVANALVIENLRIQDLRPYQNNPRHHPKSQIAKLVWAISEFGFLIPVLIDDHNVVLAGHARLEAAKELGLPSIPCIRASHLTEAQKRTFIILDNRLAEEAKWDFQLLAKEIQFLQDAINARMSLDLSSSFSH